MRYKPLGDARYRPESFPVGLVYAGNGRCEVWTSAGAETASGVEACRKLLEGYRFHTLYGMSGFHTIRAATGQEGWAIFRWAKRHTVSMERDHVRIISSRGIFAGLQPSEAIGELLGIEAAANANNVTMGSWSSMARQLWRSTLTEPVALAGRTVLKDGLYGGRKGALPEARNTLIRNVAHVDLKGAYPAAMKSAPYPTRLKESSRPHIGGDGITWAEVTLPNQPWVSLPERKASGIIMFAGGRTIDGCWANAELRAAADGGAIVTPVRTFEGSRYQDIFGPWAELIEPLRAQASPYQAKWWKGVSNSLWGTFSMSALGGQKVTVDADGMPVKREEVAGRKPPMPTSAYIASLTTARVRVQVLREALAHGWAGSVIHVDTDGVMVTAAGKLPTNLADDDNPKPGEWVVDRVMPKVLVRGPQAWAWWDEQDQAHVSISGLTNPTLQQLERVPSSGEHVITIGRTERSA